jgi:hypothetical protein
MKYKGRTYATGHPVAPFGTPGGSEIGKLVTIPWPDEALPKKGQPLPRRTVRIVEAINRDKAVVEYKGCKFQASRMDMGIPPKRHAR